MHVVTAIFILIVTYYTGDWRNWKKYHITILFFAFGNVLYNFLTANYFLWRFNADFISNHTLTEVLYTLVIFPATAILYLGRFPTHNIKAKIIHVITWVTMYTGWEAMFMITDRIHYQYGWTLAWSAAFNSIMFPLLRLHQSRPLLTYVLSAFVAIFVLWWFKVPVHIPVEDRPYVKKKKDILEYSLIGCLFATV